MAMNMGLATTLDSGLTRHINDPPLSLAWSIQKDNEFNNVFICVIKTLRKEGN
jgi:hypothetical protein